MTTRESRLVDAEGASISSESASRSWLSPLGGLGLIVDVGRSGVHLGLGLAALAYDMASGIAQAAIDRGAAIEKESLESLARFEREQVRSMKEYLEHTKRTSSAPSGASIEAHVEEALKTHDVPTRDDIRELGEQISSLDEKLSNLHRDQ